MPMICLWLFSGENILHKKISFLSQKYFFSTNLFNFFFTIIFHFYSQNLVHFFTIFFIFKKCHRPLILEYLSIYVFLQIAQLSQKLNNWGHFYSSYCAVNNDIDILIYLYQYLFHEKFTFFRNFFFDFFHKFFHFLLRSLTFYFWPLNLYPYISSNCAVTTNI